MNILTIKNDDDDGKKQPPALLAGRHICLSLFKQNGIESICLRKKRCTIHVAFSYTRHSSNISRMDDDGDEENS